MSPLLMAAAIAATLIAIAVGIVLRRIARAGLEYRGGRIVTCPETGRPAGVAIDAWHAIATSLAGEPQVRLKGCSRWLEHALCGQECLKQIVAEPRSGTIQNILRTWYEGKCCIWCGKPVAPVYWTNGHPVLLTNGHLKQWEEIPIDQLPDALTVAQPVCFACYARRNTVHTTVDAGVVP